MYRPSFSLRQGDCLEILKGMDDASIDSVVTDPPYGLSNHSSEQVAECLAAWIAGEPYQPTGRGFMGKAWDAWVPGPEVWRECLRVLKPGGHLLCFAGTRSMDLMSMAVRLAGFELRDAIGYANDGCGAPLMAWTYGSGFPKSHNLQGEHAGLGTALKPAWEPIVLARKPLSGTVVETVEAYGTGALNIDACRVAAEPMRPNSGGGGMPRHHEEEARGAGTISQPHELGRWPANLIHDGSPEVVRHFPDTAGQQGDIVGHNKERESPNGTFGKFGPARDFEARQDAEKSAARFFYCAKASTSERNEGMDHMPDAVLARSCLAQTNAAKGITSERAGGSFNVARITKNNHPTVKPVELMAYLCRLVTPPNGTVFDPFAGSGSTGVAALRENFNFVGCEQSSDYVAIARARIEYELNKPKQGALFGDELGLCPDAANL